MGNLDFQPTRCRVCGLILLTSNRASPTDNLCKTCAERAGLLHRVTAPATPDLEPDDSDLDLLARLAAFIEHYPQADVADIMAKFDLDDAQTYVLLHKLSVWLRDNG